MSSLKNLLRNILDPHLLAIQNAKLTRARSYNDTLQHLDIEPPINAPQWCCVIEQCIDLIIEYRMFKGLAKEFKRLNDEHKERKIAQVICRIIDDQNDPMDIDINTVSLDDLKFVLDENGNYQICAVQTTPVKIFAKVTSSKSVPTKKELKSADKITEILEYQDDYNKDTRKEYRKNDPMDIDIACLKNTKDLLALDEEINGIMIQCLANTCANTSFI
ncbi:hypothetical protein C1646_774774 [Rhizophagus diaphanus]|nr:hypothetical protein C1646_774774 [Rhizophagus diaphanus] [Rhizophagus sp. MUCL 43196]